MRKNLTNKHSYCLFASLVLIFIFLISIYPVEAIAFARYSAASTSTVKAPNVTLADGLAGVGSSSVSGGTYASTTVTAGLAFNVNANPMVSTLVAPSIDGSVTKGFNNVNNGTTPNLNTASANDMIYLVISILGTNSVTGVTNSGTALNWNFRAALTDGTTERVETWYAVSTSVFTGQTITVNFSSSTVFYVAAFGIKNANTANPFDSYSTLPAKNTGSGTTQSVTVSTLNPNDLVIGALAGSVSSGNAPNPTKGGSYTSIVVNHQGSVAIGVEYLSVTALQSGTAVSFSTGGTSINWALLGDVVQGVLTTAATNTTLSPPSSANSVSVTNGQSAFLLSPAYTTQTTMYAGSWAMDLWALSAKSDTMGIMILQINSANSVSSVVASGNTQTIGTKKSEVITTFAAPQITVQPGDRLLVILTNLAGASGSFTIYWGTGQVTNFKTPSAYNYVLRVVNIATSSYSLNFSTLSSSSLSRLTNLTFYVYSPTTNCIVVTNGALTQSSSPTITLPANSTIYIALNASANNFGSSTFSIQLQFSPNSNMHPFTNEQIDLTVN